MVEGSTICQNFGGAGGGGSWPLERLTGRVGAVWGFLLQLAIFFPIQTRLHSHNVGQPHNAIRILFVWTAPMYVEEAIAKISVRQRASPYPQLERGQSKSKFLIDTTNQ